MVANGLGHWGEDTGVPGEVTRGQEASALLASLLPAFQHGRHLQHPAEWHPPDLWLLRNRQAGTNWLPTPVLHLGSGHSVKICTKRKIQPYLQNYALSCFKDKVHQKRTCLRADSILDFNHLHHIGSPGDTMLPSKPSLWAGSDCDPLCGSSSLTPFRNDLPVVS